MLEHLRKTIWQFLSIPSLSSSKPEEILTIYGSALSHALVLEEWQNATPTDLGILLSKKLLVPAAEDGTMSKKEPNPLAPIVISLLVGVG